MGTANYRKNYQTPFGVIELFLYFYDLQLLKYPSSLTLTHRVLLDKGATLAQSISTNFIGFSVQIKILWRFRLLF